MTTFARRLLPAGTRVARVVASVVVLVLLAGVLAYVLTGSGTKAIKAQFSSAVGTYPGSGVRMLGVEIGKVTAVQPQGKSVLISMAVDAKYKIPANAIAVIVPPSLVSDRYVQLAPVYTGGPAMVDNATIPIERTAAPVELDDIYAALNQLSVALGPDGANKNGALSNLVDVAAANLKGNGAALGQTVTDLSKAITTLAGGREDLFGTVRNLQAFTGALQASDANVRKVNDLLAVVAGQLADERGSLASALKNLTDALTAVAGFLAQNQDIFEKDVAGLKDVTGVLANRRGALDEILATAPVALSNLAHTYNPASGTLDVRANLASLFDPSVVCQALQSKGLLTGLGPGLTLLTGATRLDGICQAVLSALPAAPTIPGLPSGLPTGLTGLVPGLLNLPPTAATPAAAGGSTPSVAPSTSALTPAGVLPILPGLS